MISKKSLKINLAIIITTILLINVIISSLNIEAYPLQNENKIKIRINRNHQLIRKRFYENVKMVIQENNSLNSSIIIINKLPYVINKPGYYILNTSCINASWLSAIEIYSSNVTLDGNNNILDGMELEFSYGINIENSKNITIKNLIITDWEVGIQLTNTEQCNLINIKFINCGLYLYESNNIKTENCTVNNKPLIYLENINEPLIKDIEVGQIILVNCPRAKIENLNITKTTIAIQLINSKLSRISNIKISQCTYGIDLWYSSQTTITNINLTQIYYGAIWIYCSYGTKISQCIIKGLYPIYGIDIISSYYCKLSNINFTLSGITIYDSLYTTIEKCYVNNKPILYLENINGLIINENNIGQLVAVNCRNLIIKGLTLSNTSAAICLWNVKDSKVIGLNIRDCNEGIIIGNSYNIEVKYVSIINCYWDAIYLLYASNCIIYKVNIKLNWWFGIILDASSSCNVIKCNINNCTDGIDLFDTLFCEILKCKIINCIYGMYINSSKLNNIYLNEFNNNTITIEQEYSYFNTYYSLEQMKYAYNNTIYNNYLGNYWSNYNGTDQNYDGIGDTSYHYNGIYDLYPLIKPLNNYLINPINITLKLYTGWNLISIPIRTLNSNIDQLFNNRGIVAYTWNNFQRKYITTNKFEPGRGYWIFSNQNITLTIIGEEIIDLKLNLSRGWNLIGSINIEGQIELIEGEIFKYIYVWNSIKHKYQALNIIPTNHGAWILAYCKAKVIIEPST